MSLINDALRRASQTEKDRARQASAPIGMEAVPAARSSRLTIVLAATVVIALLLAGLFFWQWWKMRNIRPAETRETNIFPPVTLQVAAPPVVVPKPAPVAPPAPVKPAPAPVVVAPPPVVAAPVAPPIAPPVAAPVAPPVTAPAIPAVWPVELKLNAIFFSRTNPRALISGTIYGVGDDIQGVVVKKIGIDKVTLEWSGHTKELFLESQ